MKPVRWVLTDKGREVLQVIRSERSAPGGGVDVGSELGGAASESATPASD